MNVRVIEVEEPAEIAGSVAQALLENLHTPLWLFGASGTVVWLNASAKTALRVPAKALPATIVAGVSDDVLAALTAVPVGRSLAGSVTFRSDRGEAIVSCRLSLVDGAPFGHPGKTPILAEAVVDAPARREVLRLTEQLAALSDAFPDFRLVLHRDGTILSALTAQTGESGLAPEHLRDRAMQEVLPPAAMATLLDGVRRLNGTGGVVPLDYTLESANGPRHFEGRLVALPDGVRIMAIMRDVTERRHAETAALAARNMLMDAIESISEGFVVFDAQERLVLCNSKYRDLYRPSAAALEPGTSLQDMLREGVLNGQYDLDDMEPGAWLAEQLDRHRISGAPFELRLGDGRWIRIKDWRTSEGGLVGIRTDITERKLREGELQRARDQADRANQRKSEFIHHLSHELRTPLGSVLGFAELLADAAKADGTLGPDGDSAESLSRYLAEIRAAGNYMLSLVNGLLDLARIEAGHMTVEDSACDLPMMIDMTVRMLAVTAKSKNVRLRIVPPEQPAIVRADMSMVRQMLTNIIGNAVKYTRPEGGQVDISLRPVGRGDLAVFVQDTGAGMTADEVALALSQFGQIRRLRSGGGSAGNGRAAAGKGSATATAEPAPEGPTEKGTGLGLPLTKGMMELHGGRLAIDSEPGKGTLVGLVFPADRVLSPGVDGAGG